jgi:F-type H+-transporting ATPase subunit c
MTLIDALVVASEAAAAGASYKSLSMAFAGTGAAIGVGLIGAKGVEAIGRNPGATGSVLTFGIVGMALAEGIAILAYLLTNG